MTTNPPNFQPRKRRPYASFFDWPDKRLKEYGIVEYLFEAMRAVGEDRYINLDITDEDPPDCIAYDNEHGIIGIEVTEFVSEAAIRKSAKKFYDPYFWEPEEVFQKVVNILTDKDMKKYKGGPFKKLIVVLHTDEPMMTFENFKEILSEKTFYGLKQISEAYFLVSYDPSLGYCPYIKLSLQSGE